MKKYEHESGETFLLYDSEKCQLEVRYEGLVGFIEIVSPECPGREYGYSINSAGYGGLTLQQALDVVCERMLSIRAEQMARDKFDADKACKDLHAFYESIGKQE